MKNIGYRLLKLWIKSGLYLYYGRIKISGLENVPKNRPVLFLPNHQAALMDVLLIVTDCNRKPYFLTRADVFRNPTLKKFFTFLRMLPIYRMRDGREALQKNQAVFDRCAGLFRKNHAIVLFPEANHNRQRRVRPLSKGFTRILFNALQKSPETDIHVIPVGMNYMKNDGFPDKVALVYGKSILVKGLYDPSDEKSSVEKVKKAVSDRLKVLTTHIADEANYDTIAQRLDALPIDYLNPSETNAALKKMKVWNCKVSDDEKGRSSSPDVLRTIFKAIFILLNFPVIVIWRIWVKPTVWEPEFTATLRFGFALLVYPIYYLILFTVIATIWNGLLGFAVVLGLFLFNWGYVKFNFPIKYRRN